MLNVSGSARLTFTFPAPRHIAYAYYSDMGRIAGFLTHIELDTVFPNYQYRMRYNTLELGTYNITILCDVRMDLSGAGRFIKLEPIENLPAIEPVSSLHATTARGFFASDAIFHEKGEETRIEFSFRLWAKLPRPLGMRFMPGRMVNKITGSITKRRMTEIVEGFLERSLADFPAWQATIQSG